MVLLNMYARRRTTATKLRWWARIDLRWPYLGFGFLTHAGIELLMAVGPFIWATTAYYTCAIRPQEWRRWAGRALDGVTPNLRHVDPRAELRDGSE